MDFRDYIARCSWWITNTIQFIGFLLSPLLDSGSNADI